MWLMAKERIVVALQGDDDGELLVRRAARLLHRGDGGDLIAVHVRTPAGTRAESPQALEDQRRLVADLGGSYHTVSAPDVAGALVEFARSAAASHIIVGQSRRRRFTAPFSLGVDTKVVREAADISVQVVPLSRHSSSRRRRTELGRARTGFGFALAAVLPPLLQLLLAMFEHSVATAVLIQLTGAVAVALVGGLWPAVAGALWSSLLVNYFSTPPLGDLAIHDPQDLLSLAVFVGVSVAVAGVVDGSARRSRDASRAQAEAATLGDLALGASRSEDTLHGLLAEALDAFGASGAAVVRNLPAAGRPNSEPLLLAGAGDISGWEDRTQDLRGVTGTTTIQVDPVTWLVLFGREVLPSGRRLLGAFAVHVKAQLERRQLEASRHEIVRLAEGNTMRTAILQAVSHDLRTPLAGIKLAAGGLLQNGVAYSPAEQRELLETIDACTDRLDLLVGNLLDMSRITARSVEPLLGPVRWNDAIDAAQRGIPEGAVAVALPANLPPVEADPGLLERAIANILENALKHAPGSGVAVTATGGGLGGVTPEGHPCGELRIVDHGPGVPERKVLDMFRPFQRLDDLPQASGLGLGLAVAQGFVQAMRGTLTAEGTPGGGLTMIIRLPLSTGSPRETGSIASGGSAIPGTGTVLT
jgi:two-component system sensor histidine kinase KdpD